MENHVLTGGRSYDYLLGASGNYRKIYSISSKGLFKPFTTSGNQENVPSYETPIINVNNTGYNWATSDGLNPFGINTIDEDLVWGSGMPGNLHGIPDRSSVRALGHKFPMHGVGFGFDIFGLPAPNAVTGWNASGALGTGVIPNITGWQAYSNTSGTVSGSYCQIPYWLAGPVDLRWEPHRKVWTASNGGVYAGQIIEVQVSGSVDNYTPGDAYFAEEVTYSAKIFDGVACSLTITGVAPVSPRPAAYSYKITPLASGDFCFIVHHPDQAGIPRFKIWCVESPDTESCNNIGGEAARSISSIFTQFEQLYIQDEQPNPAESSGIPTVEELFAGLALYPLALEYGGLGVSGLIPDYSIFGDASGDLVQKAWIAGTGIQIVQYGTGIEVRIASGVEFNLGSGVNTSITELQGLTTPLSIAQGGTSASTKTFVDNYADQSVSGMKTFYNPTSFSTFNISASGRPPINFINRTDAGFGYGAMSVSGLTATGIIVVSSGNGTYNDCALFSERNIILRQPVLIDVDDNNENGQWSPLRIRQNFYGDMTQDIIRVEDLAYNRIFALDSTGVIFGKYLELNSLSDETHSIKIIQDTGRTNYPFQIVSSGGTEILRISDSGNIVWDNGTWWLGSDIANDSVFFRTNSTNYKVPILLEKIAGIPSISRLTLQPGSLIINSTNAPSLTSPGINTINNSTDGWYVRFIEGSGNGNDYVQLKAPDILNGSFNIVLPTGVGASGQVLMTNDSSGTLVFGAVAGSGPFSIDDATDVSTVGLQTDDVLHYDGSNWVPTGIEYFPVSSHTHAASDITSGTIDTARLGAGSASSGTYLCGDQTWRPVNLFAQNYKLEANVNITSNATWFDAVSGVLSSGTWMVTSNMTLSRSTTTAVVWSSRITDGTNTFSTGAQFIASNNNNVANIALSTIVSVTGDLSVYTQGRCSTGASGALNQIRSTLPIGSEGANATQLTIVRVG